MTATHSWRLATSNPARKGVGEGSPRASVVANGRNLGKTVNDVLPDSSGPSDNVARQSIRFPRVWPLTPRPIPRPPFPDERFDDLGSP